MEKLKPQHGINTSALDCGYINKLSGSQAVSWNSKKPGSKADGLTSKPHCFMTLMSYQKKILINPR